MRTIYSFFILLLIGSSAAAQSCPSIQISYTASESRCVATGSLNLTVTGGSGSYNYSVAGPVNTPFTSSPQITGLQAGNYRILVRDLVNNCVNELANAYVPGAYSDPRFGLVKTDVSCLGNDGTISVAGQQNGRAPFSYTIVAPSPSSVGATSTTGSFSGLVAGEYAVQLTDSCGGIQVRRITIEDYFFWFDSTSVVRLGCDSGTAYIRLQDNKGALNTNSTAFQGFLYGISIQPGDTVWSTSHAFHFYLGNRRSATVIVKDRCGVIHTGRWSFPNELIPDAGTVTISGFTCSTFRASLSYVQNLTNPQYCLYTAANQLLGCNTTGVFTGLPYGNYCIRIRDNCYDTTIVRCFSSERPVPAVDEEVAISAITCSTFTAAITGQQGLINPQFCLFDSSNVQLACNATGIFPGLAFGRYCIRVSNGCNDTTIVRCFTVNKPVPSLTNYVVSGASCTSFSVYVSGSNLQAPQYCLYDSLGRVVTCNTTGIFNGLPQGAYCVRAISCGDTTAPICFSPSRPRPSVASSVNVTNRACNYFTASITGTTNLTSPTYCLYNSIDSLLRCNTTGVFDSLQYGSYCIRVRDNCYDTTITRCFSAQRPVPAISTTVQQTAASCTGFTATVSGSNLTNPQYCVYDAQQALVACNTTGVFTNLPWGSYCFTIRDGCVDTVMQVCRSFSYPRGMQFTTTKSCTLGNANVWVLFRSGVAPFRIRVLHPSGTMIRDTTVQANDAQLLLPALPAGARYTIIGRDGCNAQDTAFLTPDASVLTRAATVRSKCPSATWPNGAGDLAVLVSSNFYTTIPAIIRKNGTPVNVGFSSLEGLVYTFADLEPATYVVEYTMQTCGTRVYDTVTVQPYQYPTQGQSAIYQCDNNSLSLGAAVQGGVGPYNFQIIGSMPAAPSINTALQQNPVFSINTGTIYSLVRLRAIDACGNATLNDVSVLPLQNFTVAANQQCFYQEVRLSVDSIPNATYLWYRKTTPVDSTLVGTGANFNLPFFVPEEMGRYVCKIIVHGGCLTRFTYFDLNGQCATTVLPVSFRLNGREKDGSNYLAWTTENPAVAYYQVQRKSVNDRDFEAIGRVDAQRIGGPMQYGFEDARPVPGGNLYRLKIVHGDGSYSFSNTVSLVSRSRSKLYPNPVTSSLHITLGSPAPAQVRLDWLDRAGRVVASEERRTGGQLTLNFLRPLHLTPGIYQVRITHMATGQWEVHKIVLQ